VYQNKGFTFEKASEEFFLTFLREDAEVVP
jgi:hypothetical protein